MFKFIFLFKILHKFSISQMYNFANCKVGTEKKYPWFLLLCFRTSYQPVSLFHYISIKMIKNENHGIKFVRYEHMFKRNDE